jgi:hypothetical protein
MATIIPQTLLDAYNSTRYVVHFPEGDQTIRIGNTHPEIDKISTSWSFITAYNPHSEVLTKHENEKRSDELRRSVEDIGLSYVKGIGIGEDPSWEPEKSIFIKDISIEDAQMLGKKFGQNAIVYGKISEKAELIECV